MNLGVTMVYAIVAVILALSLKSKNPEYSTFISVAVCLVLLFICVSRMRFHRVSEKHADGSRRSFGDACDAFRY